MGVSRLTLKQKGRKTKKYNKLLIKPLSARTANENKQTRDFLAYPPNMNFASRIKQMAKDKAVTKALLYRYAKQMEWRDLLDDHLLNSQHQDTLEQLKGEIVTFNKEMTFSEISKVLKKNTTYSLIIGNGLLSHTLKMMEYYAERIEVIIVSAGGVMKLTAEDPQNIEYCDRKISGYKNEIKFMINPTQVSAYMNMLGINKDLANVDEEGTTMTPEYLLETMQNLGAKSSEEKEQAKEVENMIQDVYKDKEVKTDVNGRNLN